MTEPAIRSQSLPSLTGLRWGAAFVVFAYHVKNFQYFGPSNNAVLDGVVGAGTAGVSFFFVLSGFVLAWSARSGDSARRFWRRRAARIYPLHLVTALAALVLGATLVPSLAPGGITEVVANLLLVSSWNPEWWQSLNPVSWSLVCEAFFYLMFPLLIWMLRRLSTFQLRVALIALIAAVATMPLLAPWTPPHALYTWPLARLPEFIIGMVTGILAGSGRWRGPGRALSWLLTLSGFALAAFAPAVFAHAAFTIVGVTLLIPAIARADAGGQRSLWSTRPMVRLGEASYAFYLVHLLIMRVVEVVWRPDPQLPLLAGAALTVLVLSTAVLVALGLHVWCETPARHFLTAATGPKPVRVAPAAAPLAPFTNHREDEPANRAEESLLS